ncbi:MAG: molybdopterin molybdotransferase MoeA [Phycisphaerae bacterium]|nr:molybdopterin molybdotransferase MoeA [Gemmatimonadaceae bacterium]
MSNLQRTGLSLDEAVEAVLNSVTPLPEERVPLREAVGRALAQPVVSPIDLPLWDNSGMDGYAVRRADVLGVNVINPVSLPVIATIVAGSAERPEVVAGTCARIMTGAPIPPGADAVVRVEDTDRGLQHVRITDDRDVRSPAGNVRARGEDMKAGDTVFAAGTSLGAVHIGVLASVGAAEVFVRRAPRVVVVATGDELVGVEQFDEVRAGRRIVASSSYALEPWLKSLGAEVHMLPLLPDKLDVVRDAISTALDAGCDLLITTGGVSVGAHDYTREALHKLDADVAFWRARIRPGGPIGVGSVRGIPWLGLPGNPVSTMVTAELFARPLLRKLAGHASDGRTTLRVRVAEPMKAGFGLTHLLRVLVTRDGEGQLSAHTAGAQGSNLLRTMAVANALLVVPDDRTAVDAGEYLDAIMIGALS